MIFSKTLQPHPAIKTRLARSVILVPALVLPLIASLFYFTLFPGTSFGNGFYTGIKIWLVLGPIFVTTIILQERMLRRKPSGGEIRQSMLMGTAFGLATVGLMYGLMEWSPLGQIVDNGAANVAEAMDDLGVGGAKFLFFALFISLIHSAMEEFYWRWFVYGNLRHVVGERLWIAHLIAGIGFMAHHIIIVDRFFELPFAIFLGICVGIGGVVWSWLYQRHHTLWGAWISHVIVDLGIFWIGYQLIHR